MICPDCGGDMRRVEVPEELICWRLGSWEIRLWKWVKGWWCGCGDEDPYARASDDAYAAGHADGWRERELEDDKW